VGKIIALMIAARADTAAWDADRLLTLIGIRWKLARLTFAQREMHALGCHFLAFRQVKQLAQRVLRAFGFCTDDTEVIASPPDPDIQTRFEQPEILIERAAQIREPYVIRRLEIEFALR
jgi:hypothetical protein